MRVAGVGCRGVPITLTFPRPPSIPDVCVRPWPPGLEPEQPLGGASACTLLTLWTRALGLSLWPVCKPPKTGAGDPYPSSGAINWLREDFPGDCGWTEGGSEALLIGSGAFDGLTGSPARAVFEVPSLVFAPRGRWLPARLRGPWPLPRPFSLVHLPGDLLGPGQTGLSPEGQPSADCGRHRFGGCILCSPNEL